MRFIKLFKDTFKFGIKLVSAFLGAYAVHKFMPEYADPALMVGILYGSFVTAFFLKNSFVTLIWGVNGKPAKIKSTPISVDAMETYVAAAPELKKYRWTIKTKSGNTKIGSCMAANRGEAHIKMLSSRWGKDVAMGKAVCTHIGRAGIAGCLKDVMPSEN